MEIIKGDTQVGRILAKHDDMQNQVADLLDQEYPSDIYSSVVSSQFDADRLDYLRRDKLMTGTEQGGFDWAWLLNNLEIGKLTIGGDGEDSPSEVDGLILGQKGLKPPKDTCWAGFTFIPRFTCIRRRGQRKKCLKRCSSVLPIS